MRRMNITKWLLVVFLAVGGPSLAQADTYILGDSIGDGVATTLGLHNLAQIGIHIRGPKALAQIARTPPGSTVFIFLGTNDAEDGLKGIEKSIDDVVDAAARRDLHVIWIGPHCVRKAWDSHVRQLDDVLRGELGKTSVKYVSMHGDAAICSGKFHEPDGIHLTGKGYRYMWTMLQNMGDAPAGKVLTADGDGPATTGASGGKHRMVMEIHVPGALSEPLVWTRSQN
jgi:lysophospholipase L1-like esterase